MIAFVHLDPADAAAAERTARILAWLRGHGLTRLVVATPCGEGRAEWSAAAAIELVDLPAPDAVATALRELAIPPGAGPIVVVDAARWFSFDLQLLRTEHAESPAIATLAVCGVEPGVPGGVDERRVDVDRAGRVLGIVPAPRDPDLPLASIGCSVVEPDLLLHVPAGEPFGLESDLFGLVLRRGGILSAVRVEAQDERPTGGDKVRLALR